MDKEDVLKLSREENEGRRDEREMAVASAASKVGMMVGGLACVVLVFIGRFILNIPEISLAGWVVYFSMYGGSNLFLFKELGKRENLIWGVVISLVAVGFAVALMVKGLM